MKKFFQDFKEFAMRGNVIDMAIGVIIGGAFSSIVSSLVNDVIMPVITLLTGAADFTSMSFVLKAATAESEAIAINYGSFIQAVIDFLIIALVIFIMLRFIMKLTSMAKKEEEAAEEPPAGPTSEELLTEIRDLLKDSKN
ncbi:MAG: large-conductance mechanosensitive channel protein MscL [Erysipelotrichaceae bacterium]|nr:large-conductance mechanosensitive channel protein MscL [Erysipelotrichaceae bacterium]